MYISHILSVHLSIDGHLGCFLSWLLETGLQWTLDCMYYFKLVFLFSLGKNPEIKLLDLMAVVFSNFLDNIHNVFHSGCTGF